MATAPDQDLVTLLNGAIGSLTENTNLFKGKMQPVSSYVPADSVFCLSSGGPAPQAYADGSAVEQYHPAVQIMIRNTNFLTGQTLARSVRNAVNHATISGYIDVRIGGSDPLYINEEETGFHLWSINVELWHEA
jgi:hypothetical protein